MATNVHLTPELESFARSCVESGRYNNVSEVMRSALRLLQDQEERRRAFTKSLEDAMEEAERVGTFTLDEVLADMDAVIDASDAKSS
jgi:antitoxin ParD1/3/4